MNYVSSFYPQEHRTPPLPLVALLGVPELHREISDYFIQQHRPPLVFHGSSEPLEQFVARAFGEDWTLYFLHPGLVWTIGKPGVLTRCPTLLPGPKKRSQLLSGQPQGILKVSVQQAGSLLGFGHVGHARPHTDAVRVPALLATWARQSRLQAKGVDLPGSSVQLLVGCKPALAHHTRGMTPYSAGSRKQRPVAPEQAGPTTTVLTWSGP